MGHRRNSAYADAHLSIRANSERLAAYKSAAERAGRKLTDWVSDALERQLRRQQRNERNAAVNHPNDNGERTP